jgi:ferric-dicitrate binding protein FerR (iron transport regulator)
MTEREPRPVTPEEASELQRAIRGLGEPRMDPGARARIKRAFLDGNTEATVAAHPGVPERRRVRPWRWKWALAAAAAIACVVLVRDVLLPVGWTVQHRTGSGTIAVDGRHIPLDDSAALERAVRDGGRVVVPPGASIVIAAGDVVSIELMGETDAKLPSPPHRFFATALDTEVRAGEMRVASGADLRGRGLSVRTPDGRVEITGTIFAVMCDDVATCVCVLEGVVRVGRDATAMEDVVAGMRKVMFRDARPSIVTESAAPHREGLEDFRARLGG